MKEIEDLHVPFEKWLNDNRVPYIHFRSNQRTGLDTSHPDFTILWMGGNVSIEFKTPTGKLSEKQAARIKYLEASGNRVEVCRSVEDAIKAIPWAGIAKFPAGPRTGSYAGQFANMRAVVESTVAKAEHKPEAMPEFQEGQNKPPFVIMKFGGLDAVFARGADGSYVRCRKASAADIINFPRFNTKE